MFNCYPNQLAAPPSVIRFGAILLAFLAAFVLRVGAAAQSVARATLSSPTPDQVLQGAIHITGTADSPNFASAELAFAYASDSTNTWFLLQTLDQPVADAELATWDTTAISDGEYVLRLRVNSLDGTFQDASVAVQVRNYTAPPAVKPTAAPTQPPVLQIPTAVVLVPSATPVPQVPSTPTPLPANPAALTISAIYAGFWRGALLVIAVFAAAGILLVRRRS